MYKAILVGILSLLMFSCRNATNNNQRRPNAGEARKMLQRVNKYLVNEDRDAILNYMERNKLEGMHESKTGLFYLIYGKANGPQVKKGDIVEYSFKVSLLDGTVCYHSTPDSLGTFLVGRGGVESGLEEGILYMKQGQKAKFIMPPHLAHGLIGDAKRIPARSIIVYDLELFRVIDK